LYSRIGILRFGNDQFYGPGEGYYPDGGYGYAEGLADVDAWEHAAELSHN
jgi:hypothetical protein